MTISAPGRRTGARDRTRAMTTTPQVKSVWHAGFWSVWMFIAKVGNPDLEFRELESNTSNINIGGYGMF